jgi:crossover junction endodeoxyribonuclease RusA
MAPLELAFPRPGRSVTANGRHHWAEKRRLLQPWILSTRAAWIQAGRPQNVGPSIVEIRFGVNDKRRRDPSNLMPTQKAIVDELVRCGLWPDDTPEWLEERMPTIVLGDHVIVRITPRGDDVALR